MANPHSGFQGEGNYSNASNEARALKRAQDKMTGPAGLERVQAFEVVKPDPNPEWCEEAKMTWVLASHDEATLYWSSGDWLHLYLACDYLDKTYANAKTRTPSAQAMTVIMDTLKSLKLTETAKRGNGILIDREPVTYDETDEWLRDMLRAEVEAGVIDGTDSD